MASRQPNVTAQFVLGKISRDHLECPICKDRFTQPKILDCLHSFCQECLKEVKQRQHPQDSKLVCPLCRCKTILKGDVSHLPNDFKLSALVDEVNVHEKLLEGQRSQINCQACDQENQAVSRCMDCDHFLCKECQAVHGRMTLMKSHQIYTLAQLQSGEVTYKSKIREYTPKCGNHSDQNLTIYCNTCEKLVCTTCAIVDHERHSCVDLSQAVDKCNQDVARMSAKAKQNKAKLKTNLSEIDANYKKLNTMYADTTKKISSKADKEVARITKEIRQEEQKLRQEADTFFKDRAKTLEIARATNSSRLTQTEKKLHEVTNFVTQASCHELLDFKPKLLFNLKESTKEHSEKGPDSMSSFMEFEEGTGTSLGRLVLEDSPTPSSDVTAKGSQTRWKLKRRMETFGPTKKTFGLVDEIATLSNNEIVALDRKHNKLITLQSDEISQELQLAGLTEPSHVTVNRDDEIVVLDKPSVKIFKKGVPSCLHQFQPGRGILTSDTPTCLAVDGGDVIAVGYQKQKKISLHERDGSLIRRLPAPMIGYNLTIYKQRLFYTYNGDNKTLLLSVDTYGHMVFTVDIPSNSKGKWHAGGLCCDKDGNIYVAVSGWPVNPLGAIQLFSHDGQYLGCVFADFDCMDDITCTPAGELVVATTKSVCVYHKV